MKTILIAAALAGTCFVISLIVAANHYVGSAQSQGVTSLSIDVIPEGNTPTTVAGIETCVSAEEGDAFDVDLIIENVTDLLAWEAYLQYDPQVLEIVEGTTEMFQAANDNSRVQDLSGATPDGDGSYSLQSIDIAEPPAPDSGSGVLARLTLSAKSSGISELTVGKVDLNDDGRPDQGPLLRDVAGDIIGDDDGDSLFDGPINDAEVRVGESCSGQALAATVPAASSGGVDIAVVVGATAGIVVTIALATGLGAVLIRRRATQR